MELGLDVQVCPERLGRADFVDRLGQRIQAFVDTLAQGFRLVLPSLTTVLHELAKLLVQFSDQHLSGCVAGPII